MFVNFSSRTRVCQMCKMTHAVHLARLPPSVCGTRVRKTPGGADSFRTSSVIYKPLNSNGRLLLVFFFASFTTYERQVLIGTALRADGRCYCVADCAIAKKGISLVQSYSSWDVLGTPPLPPLLRCGTAGSERPHRCLFTISLFFYLPPPLFSCSDISPSSPWFFVLLSALSHSDTLLDGVSFLDVFIIVSFSLMWATFYLRV